MSTEYTIHPPINYDDFIEFATQSGIEMSNAPIPYYPCRHKVICHNGSYLYVFEDDLHNIWFERFGINQVNNVFPKIIKELGVQIFDEFGNEYFQEKEIEDSQKEILEV